MNRYPHKIIIQKVVTESSPYADAEYETVYEGRCRCFMDGRSSIDTQGDSESNYQVVISLLVPRLLAGFNSSSYRLMSCIIASGLY